MASFIIFLIFASLIASGLWAVSYPSDLSLYVMLIMWGLFFSFYAIAGLFCLYDSDSDLDEEEIKEIEKALKKARKLQKKYNLEN